MILIAGVRTAVEAVNSPGVAVITEVTVGVRVTDGSVSSEG